MKKLAKSIRMVGLDGTTEADTIEALVEAESKHGQQMKLIRRWMQGGYLLEKLGHGFLESLIAKVDAGMTEGMSQEQQARFIGELISRTMWMKPAVKPVESKKEFQVQEAPVVLYEEKQPDPIPPPDDDDDDFDIHLDLV